MTKIRDLKPAMRSICMQGYIVEKRERRTVKIGMTGKNSDVCDFMLSDTAKPEDGNSITLVLWNTDIDKFRVGDKVEIGNGYTSTFKNETQLNVGKYGSIKLAAQ